MTWSPLFWGEQCGGPLAVRACVAALHGAVERVALEPAIVGRHGWNYEKWCWYTIGADQEPEIYGSD